MSVDLPPPSLDELLAILSSNPELSASPGYNDTMTLNFTFKRPNFAAGSKYVFEYPSLIFPEIKKQLELLRELLASIRVLEDAYRFGDPKKSIDDSIAFLEQELNQDVRGLGSLYTNMRREHLNASMKYLRELGRRRRDAEEMASAFKRRQAEEHEARRKADEEDERKRYKEEAHRRWDEQEAAARRRQQSKTSESGYTRGSPEEAAWEAFRQGGGFEHMRGKNHYEDSFRRATEEEIRRRQNKAKSPPPNYDFNDFFRDAFSGGNNSNHRQSPPPPSGTKRKWFEILGCPAGSTADQIRKAARQASKGLHPDKNKDPEAMKKFQEISEAKAEGLQGL